MVFPGEIFRGEAVPDKAVNDAADKQRDYIVFMGQVLDVCLEFKKKMDSGSGKIFFREKGAAHDWYTTGEEDWVNSLIACVYDAIASGKGKRELEISRSGDGAAEDFISLQKDLEIKADRASDAKSSSSAEGKIKNILERLQNGFVDGEIADRLKGDSERFFSVRNQLLTRKSVFHLKTAEIEEYLSKYYELLRDLVLFYDAFDQEQDRDVFVGELLRLDAVYDEKNNIRQLNFWSPIVLNKLQKVNYGIDAFFKESIEGNAAKSKWLQEIYKHIVLIKAQHDFRWYMPGGNQKLLHAAIAPYVDNQQSGLRFQVPVHKLDQYNSYEGIKELRLGEKILYEYELVKDKAGSQFRVALMGDLHAKPVEELYDYVNKKIEKPDGDFSLVFNLYTKNELKEFDASRTIIYQGSPSETLINRNKLGQVIDTNHVVFILDCVELYKSFKTQKETHVFVKHRFAFKRYCDCSTGIERADICDQNMLEELYGMMTCRQSFGQFGSISKVANNSLLEFCEEKQKAAGRKSAIYVYVSDMQAFDNIYHDDQYYIRTERYNQKEIGIIRYSSEKVTALAAGAQNNRMLVFNIWQFIKNIAIDERNLLLSDMDKSDDAYMALDQIYIGIDYKEWPSLLEVHYYCEEKRFENVAVRFIKEILLPVLNNRDGDMFNEYIRKAMYSFFFSSAKSVNDMLFAHLFMNKANLLGRVALAEENDAEKVTNNINIRYKFSSKRFYDMIMKNYDMSSNMYVGQIRTAQIIRENERKENRIRKDKIYQNVITACKNLSYENTYLVKNCEMELKGRY